MFPRFFAPILLIGLVSPSISAQAFGESDTLPFHRGQWAAQFGGGLGLATLGVLRFSSPRHAWHLDVRLTGAHGEDELTVPLPTGGDTTRRQWDSDASVSLRVGRRSYRLSGRQVTSFFTLGAVGGFTHSAGGERGFSEGESNGWSAGAFGEVGGNYLVSDQLGIGVTADVSVVYSRSTFRSSTGAKGTSWAYRVTTPNLRFVAMIYF